MTKALGKGGIALTRDMLMAAPAAAVAMKDCCACLQPKEKAQYSKSQWSKGEKRMCAACVAEKKSPEQQRAAAKESRRQRSQLTEAAVQALDSQISTPRGDDAMSIAESLATTAVSIESTNHLRERKAERGIDKRELQLAVKHGTRTYDEATGNLQFRFQGVCYVTDPSGRIGVTSWVESTSTRPAMVTLFICSGRQTKGQCDPRNPAAAEAVATTLLLRELDGDSAPPFYLMSLETYEPMPSDGAAPGEQYVVMLLGPFHHISPMVNDRVAWPPTEARYKLKPIAPARGHSRAKGEPQPPKPHAWLELSANKYRIPSDLFTLAMRLRMGVPANPASEEQQVGEATTRDVEGDTHAAANLARKNAAAREHMSEAGAKLMRVYHALQEEGRLAELTQIGQMIHALDAMEKEIRKSDRVDGRANNPLRKGVVGPESFADIATKTREAIESYDLNWKQPGSTATLAELKGRPELNETTCKLLKFDRSAGRWQVRLPTGECIRVKPANMHPFRAKPKVMA